MDYRRDISPHYSRWVRDGLTRLRDHKAMRAALQLAEVALQYTFSDTGDAFGHQLRVSRMMSELRAHGVTAEVLFCRVAEFVAYFEHRPAGTLRLREENFAIARGVAHMVRWAGRGTGQGVALLAPLGQHIREHVYPYALAFVRRLIADQEKVGALMRQAQDFG